MTGYVYRCHEADGALAYVGSSCNAIARLENHRSSAWWAYRITHVDIRVYPSMDDARSTERDAIRNEHPRWNVMGRWSTRHIWTAQQWQDYYTALLNQPPSSSLQRRNHIAFVENRYARLFGRSIEAVSA